MNQLTLGPFVDPLTMHAEVAQAAAEEGMDRAARAERVQQWKASADAWLDRQPIGQLIQADHLVTAVGLPDEGPARNNVVGAWFSAKSKAGRIAFIGEFAKSERVVGHGNLQRVWRVA